MDTTIKALQALYVALGGNLTDTYDDIADGVAVSDYAVIPDIINALAKVAKPAGEGLPAVTVANAGEALIVGDDGKWGVDGIPAELPDVTASDNGSVLKVVNGEWAVSNS